jgi:transcriptional regulator with XRE-family HTH domain
MTNKIKTLGDEIRRLRLENNLSLKQLADKIIKDDGKAISRAYLNDIEKHHRIPSPDIIEKIANALDYSADKLLLLANKISLEAEKVLLEQPGIGGLLRKAKEVGFDDWKEIENIIAARIEKKKHEKDTRQDK